MRATTADYLANLPFSKGRIEVQAHIKRTGRPPGFPRRVMAGDVVKGGLYWNPPEGLQEGWLILKWVEAGFYPEDAVVWGREV